MEKLKLEDFKKYVKEEYNCDISTKESANPDTFDNIFNGNFINTDLMVDKILNKQDFTNKVGAIPIVKIAKDFGFAIYKASDMPEGMLGNIFVGSKVKMDYGTNMVIIVDANKDYKFQRIIIAHELACYLIEYMPKYNDKNNVYSHPYNSEIDIIHKCSMEMLMPKKVFTEQYAKAIKKSDFNMTYTLTYLSELFKVPEVEIKNRIIDILEEK
jgi:hypothetical protein